MSDDLDIQAEFARLRALSVFRKTPARRAQLQLDPGNLGEAYIKKKTVVVYVDPGLPPSRVRTTLLHELTHVSGRWGHDHAFAARLLQAGREGYGIEPPPGFVVRVDGFSAAIQADCLIEMRLRFPRLSRKRWFYAIFNVCLHTWRPRRVR